MKNSLWLITLYIYSTLSWPVGMLFGGSPDCRKSHCKYLLLFFLTKKLGFPSARTLEALFGGCFDCTTSLIANSYWCFCYIKKMCLLFKKRKWKLRLTLRVIPFWNWGSFSAFSLGLPRAEMWFTLTDLRQFKPQKRVKTQKSESWSLCSCDLLSVKVMPGHYMYCILTYAKNCILTYAENSKL